ncbi:MAG TPA: hypothetical protein VGK61_07595 [Planctomycetota bacterium]
MRMLIALATAALLTSGAAPQDSARVVVHEWGTFTSVSGGDGASLEWRPLSGPSDLPSFVYTATGAPKGLRHGAPCAGCGHVHCNCQAASCNGKECCRGCKGCEVASVRMETPVLYFYSDRETTLSVKVDFPKGKITEWYPRARQVGKGIDWGGVKVLPGAKVELPNEVGDSHYYPARETDANPVRVCGANTEHEKFLFYRGVGTFDLPLRVTLAGDKVTVRNVGKDPIAQVVLFENRGGKVGYGIHCGLTDEVSLERPDASHGVGDLMGDLAKILTTQGLYEREAKAMIKTWRDSWFEPGLRVFYVVPRRATDVILPITIEPKPENLVRVLVGRAEILTPEMETAIAAQAAKLGEDSIEAREAAMAALRKYGRFAEPTLRKVLAATEDPEVRMRIRNLIGG